MNEKKPTPPPDPRPRPWEDYDEANRGLDRNDAH